MITVTQTYGGNFIVPIRIPNLRRQGVPPGGPADPLLARLVSHLSKSQTVLELTAPITLETDCPIKIAIAAPRNSASIPHHPTMCLGLITASPGTPLTIHAPKTGFRIYLSWSGLDSPSLLPVPITMGHSLASLNNNPSQSIILDPELISPPANAIRYLPIIEVAPQVNCQTTPSLSRIGTRLSLETLHLSESQTRTLSGGQGWEDQPRLSPDLIFAPPPPLGEDLGGGRQGTSKFNPENPPASASANTGYHFWNHLTPNPRSEPSTHGAIQITPDNQLLIHGPDGPTLGGYPKIGTIIEADLSTLAQLRPGQPMVLTPVSLEEALDLRQESALQLQKSLLQINQALRIAHNST